jgi:hypothetical protein
MESKENAFDNTTIWGQSSYDTSLMAMVVETNIFRNTESFSIPVI